MTKPPCDTIVTRDTRYQPLADRYDRPEPQAVVAPKPPSAPPVEAPLGPLGNPRGKARAKMYAHNRRIAARRARRRTES